MSDSVKHICFELATDKVFVKQNKVKIAFLNGDWAIELCEDCDNDEFPFAEAGVYLCKDSSRTEVVYITSRTSLVDWNGVEREVQDYKCRFDSDISSSSIWRTSTNVFRDYVSDVECYRSYLKIEIWLSDNLQTQTVPELREGPFRCQTEIQTDLDSLSSDLSSLLEGGHCSDVTLASGSEIINAHKVILAARSKVFRAMFQHDMQESRNNSVNIEDIESEVLQIFVKYLYTGKFPAITSKIASDLYAAADKYAVRQLKMKCASVLSSSVSEDSVLHIMNLANCHSDPSLKQKAIDFVLKHEEILHTDEWICFSEEQPKLAVEVYRAFVEENKKRREALGEYLMILSEKFVK